MYHFKEKSSFILFIFLILALFITRPQLVYSQFDTDTQPPNVVQTTPQDGQTNVPVNSSIEVLFSEPMDTVFLYNPFIINPYLDGQILWEQQDRLLIFSPALLLDHNETYQVTIDKEASDLSGKSLANPYQWSFITELSPWLHFSDILGLPLDQNIVKLILGDVNGAIWVVLSSAGSSDDLYMLNGFESTDFSKINKSFGLINTIDQDSDGKIWVASESDDPGLGGVHVFNGTNWTQYNTNTNPIFSDNKTTCLAVDSEDNVWVGSSLSGIYMFDGSLWTNYNMTNSGLSNDWIIAIEADEDDYIWVSTPFAGIEGFDPQTNTWMSYTSDLESQLGISFPLISKLLAGSGKLWAVTNLGLLSYDIAADQWGLYSQIGDYSLDESRLNALALDDSNDTLWIGTEEGLIAFDGVNGDPIALGDAGPEVREIALDAYGNKWLGTSNSLSRYDTESPVLLSLSPSANKKNVSRNTKIILTFSEPMDMGSVLNSLSFSPSFTFTSSTDSASVRLTITPKSKLNSNKKYTVTVGKTATDIQGHPLTQSTSWSFTTEKSTTTTGTTGTFPSPSITFPATSFGRLPAFSASSFGSFPTFSATSFGRLPAFSASSFGRFPAFSASSFGRLPAFSASSMTFSPFRSIGELVFPRL